MRLILLVFALMLALPVFGARNFGDEVVECVVSQGAKPSGPLLDEQMAACEKDVQRARNLTAQPVSATPSDSEQDAVYVRCLIKRGVVPPQISKEDGDFCLVDAGVPDPGDGARNTKHKVWRDCLIPRVVNLDDGVSPVRDIAGAVAKLCAEEWRGVVNSLWMNPSARRKMGAGLDNYGTDDAVYAVLSVRSASREKTQKPQPRPQSKYQPL